MNFFLYILSFFLLALAQPDWSSIACFLVGGVGYAVFWYSIKKAKKKFLLAVLWFASVQGVHLSWFMSDHYVGAYIYLFLLIALVFLGVQFGLVTLMIISKQDLSYKNMLAISGIWTLFEWSRLFMQSGFSWNPVGLSLTADSFSIQFANLGGIFFLSFWIFFTNLLFYKWLNFVSVNKIIPWGVFFILPYVYGFAHFSLHDKKMKEGSESLSALLVQTSIYPEEKMLWNPAVQWSRILEMLAPYRGQNIDLIILPEAALPLTADYPYYYFETVRSLFENYFGDSEFFPAKEDRVGNSFWAKCIANAFNADVVAGFEDREYSVEGEKNKAYNAAFLFKPFSEEKLRYEKRVLVPMGEYIPFEWCKKILLKYGISDSYCKGQSAKVFLGKKTPFSTSICYEETYGYLMRENRKKGANLLVNLTNDVWYPHSRLPSVHFFHGRVRAVENGIPLFRACNTGVTAGIDSLGRTVGMLNYETSKKKSLPEVLFVTLCSYHFPTLYSRFGDMPILLFSLSFAGVFFVSKRKLFILKELNISLLRKN